MSLHKTHICVVKSLVKIAAVSWHSLRRFIKPAPEQIGLIRASLVNGVDIYGYYDYLPCAQTNDHSRVQGECGRGLLCAIDSNRE